jgi:hypothetical protein
MSELDKKSRLLSFVKNFWDVGKIVFIIMCFIGATALGFADERYVPRTENDSYVETQEEIVNELLTTQADDHDKVDAIHCATVDQGSPTAFGECVGKNGKKVRDLVKYDRSKIDSLIGKVREHNGSAPQ